MTHRKYHHFALDLDLTDEALRSPRAVARELRRAANRLSKMPDGAICRTCFLVHQTFDEEIKLGKKVVGAWHYDT